MEALAFENTAELQRHYKAVRRRIVKAAVLHELKLLEPDIEPDIEPETESVIEPATEPEPQPEEVIEVRPRVTVAAIIRIAEDHHKVVRGLLRSRSRNYVACAARADAIAAVKFIFPGCSMPFIGRQFGWRDHTTVLYSLRRRGWEGCRWHSGAPDWANEEFGRWAEEELRLKQEQERTADEMTL